MQNLNVEMKSRQEKLKEDLETEIIRIMKEYGKRGIAKNVDLGIYLSSMFGHTEAVRYLNKFRIGGRGFF